MVIIEIPILRPRSPAETQEPVGNLPMEATITQEPVEGQPHLENFMYENELLNENVRVLREELEKWKEVSKNKATKILETLVEAANRFENPLSILEKEELLCPECGNLFKLSRDKVEKMEIASWKLAHSGQGRDDKPNVESIKEIRLEVDVIPEQELQENEEL